MNTFILYMLKSAVYIAGFYIVYFLFLSRDTFYSRNRTYLVSTLLISFILPAITLPLSGDGAVYYFGRTLSEIIISAGGQGEGINGSRLTAGGEGITILQIYLAGVLFFTLKLLADILILSILIIKKKSGRIIYFSRHNTSAFSAFGYIFINRSAPAEEAESILQHEQNHIDRNHYIDILLLETVIIFQWFNPFVHLVNRSLRAIHEYQADECCLRSGITIVNYQHMLLNNLLQTRLFLSSSSFSNPSLIRKRMLMMTKVRTRGIANIKMLFVIPVAIIMLVIMSAFELNRASVKIGSAGDLSSRKTPEVIISEQQQSPAGVTEPGTLQPPPPPPPPPPSTGNQEVKKFIKEAPPEKILPAAEKSEEMVPGEIFTVVEEMPQFPGGDKAIMEFIYENMVYPQRARELSLQGRVIVRFAVTAEGKVSNIMVLRGVDKILDDEAIRVIGLLPVWKPGKQGGKPVNVWYNIPVTFQLQ